MINVIFTIVLGVSTYQVTSSCKEIGGVYFSRDDSSPRTLNLCKDTLSNEVIEHELMHVCFHDHKHNFKTAKELKDHLDQEHSEDYTASVVAPCLVENREKLYKALEQYHVINLY